MLPRLKADLHARLPSTGQTALHLTVALGDLGVLRVLKVRWAVAVHDSVLVIDYEVLLDPHKTSWNHKPGHRWDMKCSKNCTGLYLWVFCNLLFFLFFSCSFYSVQAVGAELDATDMAGHTALHLACHAGHVKVVQDWPPLKWTHCREIFWGVLGDSYCLAMR